MPIFIPGGGRDKRGRSKGNGSKRKVVAVLQLTAMVDLFTVLVVFLLQNYATTGDIIVIPKEVALPDAREVKELMPSNVIVLSPLNLMLNNVTVASFDQVKAQEDWLIEPLRQGLVELIAEGERERASMPERIRQALSEARGGDGEPARRVVDEFRKITIQADKEMDFLNLKKVMYTATEAGIEEINFAVIMRPDFTPPE